jgi:hypothetical protein
VPPGFSATAQEPKHAENEGGKVDLEAILKAFMNESKAFVGETKAHIQNQGVSINYLNV